MNRLFTPFIFVPALLLAFGADAEAHRADLYQSRPAAAATGNAPPAAALCGGGTALSYPGPDKPPVARIWHIGDGAKDAPDCTGMHGRDFTMLMSLTGSLRNAGGTPALLAAFGRISSLQGLRYWSASDRRWGTLIAQASALGGPDPSRKREDFTAAELGSGKDVYFLQKGDGSYNQVVFHMRVLESGPDRLSLLVENANKINYWFLPLFKPGDIQMLYTLTRAPDGAWHYRSLWGVKEAGLAAAGNHDASYENRAAAMYRHIAGIPADQEPPLMRDNRKAGGGSGDAPVARARLGSLMPAAGGQQ